MFSPPKFGLIALAGILSLSIHLTACSDPDTPSPPLTSIPATASGAAGVPAKAVIPRSTQPAPLPTPHPGNTPWAIQRMDAVALLYDLSGPGEALLLSLDFRQMTGEPGFFGSYGFKHWTGVGEAKPTGVMHELSHAYWGGFAPEGLTLSDWEIPPGEDKSPAMKQYHSDVLEFMAQPPDGYELFRQRLRNLPKLSHDNLEPLFHHLEADLVYSTGGSLALTPPILRKYWSSFLTPGIWDSWTQAAAWYRSLDDGDRATANKWLGFEHLDLRRYRPALQYSGAPGVDARKTEAIRKEERQRLFDLANQFESLLGEPQPDENFQFWRGYLGDKLQLHLTQPGYLRSLDSPTADDLATALDFLDSLEGVPVDQQALRLETQLAQQPLSVNFLPALENKVLLALFSRKPMLPSGATLQATASFVERLEGFGTAVDLILAKGAADPMAGGQELTAYLQRTGLEPEEDVKLFMELLRDADFPLASRVVQTLSSATVDDLIKVAPFHLRTLLTAGQLFDQLKIVETAPIEEIVAGISLFLEHPSGNFRVEEPFLSRMHQVAAGLAESRPNMVIGMIRDTAYPLEGMIQEQPQAAVAAFTSDVGAAAQMIKNSDPVVLPPARLIYRLISADPVFAARMTAELDQPGEETASMESLAYFAYDKARRDWWPDLGISLEHDGEYLQALWRLKGGDWLEERLDLVLELYNQRMSDGEVSPDWVSQYRATWEAAVSTLALSPERDELSQMFARVAQEHGSGP